MIQFPAPLSKLSAARAVGALAATETTEGRRVGAYGWESRAILRRHAFLVGWIVAVVIVVAVHVVVVRVPQVLGQQTPATATTTETTKMRNEKKNS